ncbi:MULTISPECIES: hypothetical protein [Enterobacter cloacae complex]|uniref:hypothetical protein n=1 Tax=Enterobacter cloacae complex TaxID=354276 RepID=UPI00312C8D16
MSNIDKQACQVSRYDLVSGYMQKWPDGEFVYHSDYQALLDELEAVQKVSAARLEAIDTTHKMFQRERDRAAAAEKRSSELSQKADIYDMLRQDYELHGSLVDFVDWQAKRIADQRETLLAARSYVMQCARIGDAHANGVLQAIDRAAAGKGEAS